MPIYYDWAKPSLRSTCKLHHAYRLNLKDNLITFPKVAKVDSTPNAITGIIQEPRNELQKQR